MANDPLIKYFFGGFVRLHILYHSARQPICGVEMIEELRRHGYELSPGTLYPILHQLERSGYIGCRTRVVAGRRRKDYRITASGRKLLREGQTKLRELTGELLEGCDRMANTKRRRSVGPDK